MIDPRRDLLKILNVRSPIILYRIGRITDGNTLEQVNNRRVRSGCSFRRSWHLRRDVRGLGAKPGALITGEEECLVPFDGAAECAAGLIALEGILYCSSPVPGIE